MPHGRGPDYDCWGLVWAIYKEQLQLDLPSYDLHYFSVKGERVAELIDSERKKWAKVEHPKEFDVVVIKIASRMAHVGLVIKPGWMLHVLEGAQTCIESYESMRWRNRIDGIYRYNPGIV